MESFHKQRRTLLLGVLALAAAAITAIAQTSGGTSEELTSFTGPPDRGGPARRSGSVTVGPGAVVYEHADVVLHESLGDVTLVRQFRTSPGLAPKTEGCLPNDPGCVTPRPSEPLGLFGGSTQGSAVYSPWSLNLSSYVQYGIINGAGGSTYIAWTVTLPGGQTERFDGHCSPGTECPTSGYGVNGRLLMRTLSSQPGDGYPPGPGFTYRDASGTRYFFLAYYAGDGSSSTERYYLTAVEDGRYAEPGAKVPLKYKLTYAQPVGCTDSGAILGGDPGVPYIATVTTGDGAVLQFNYSTTGVCRLTSIALNGKLSTSTLVRYDYGTDLSAMTVTTPDAGQLTYTAVYVNSNWSWTVGRDGGADQGTYVLDAGPYNGFNKVFASRAKSYTTEDTQLGYATGPATSCDGGTAFPICAFSYTDEWNAGTAAIPGESVKASLREQFAIKSGDTWEGWLVTSSSQSCLSGQCSSVTSKSESWTLQRLTNGLTVTSAHQGVNGAWDQYSNTVNANGWREFVKAAHGAASATDPSPPDVTNFTYEYHNPRAVPEQYIKSSSKPSVLQSGGSTAQTRVYDPSTNRLKAEFISGYTKALGSSTPALQTVGKFYFAARTSGCGGGSVDPLGRTLEIHGPCLVAGTGATDCPSGVMSVTLLSYYPDTDQSELGFNGTKLASKTVYVQPPSGGAACSGTALTTTYSRYDAWGHPTVITDPNGSATTRSYQGEWLVSEIKSGAGISATTTNVWDPQTGAISSTTYPTGNRELFCYRTGASTACAGGSPSGHLQWKARVSGSGSILERVDYTYEHGRAVKETYSDASGVRRVLNHVYDPQGRLTADGPGTGSYVFQRASFDATDSPRGIGAPYNNPSPFCGASGDGVPHDSACSALSYDRLGRLVSAATPAVSGTSSTSCISYDSQGHPTGIAMGVTGMSCTQALAGNAPVARYEYDDFGRLLSVTAPWLGSSTQSSGTIYYEYDALGSLTKKQTPAMREALPSGEYLSYDYDSLGRVTAAWHQHPGGSPAQELLYAFAYDTASSLSGVPVPTGCTLSNTKGRVKIRADSFGTTFYSYNALGQMTDEFRIRAGAPAGTQCRTNTVGAPSDQTPSTHRVYSSIGLLTDLTYPHGRHLKYAYGAAGSGREDQLQSIQYGDWASGVESFKTLVRNIQYEPYGSMAKYEHVAPSISTSNIVSVEFLLGAPGALPGSQACNAARPGSLDGTGRLGALWVSKAPLGSGTADLLRKTYTWKADQLAAEDSCVLTTTGTSSRTYFGSTGSTSGGYDNTLELVHASRPSGEFATKGGAFGKRDYTYDTRGNRKSDTTDCFGWANTYSATHGDQLLSRSVTSGCPLMPNPKLTVKYAYDSDGRASRKSWPSPSAPSTDAAFLSFDASIDAAHAALGAVYKAVSVNGFTYEYYYDADGRRRLKSYPSNGGTDEYFYDADNSLLEDRGLDGSGGYTLDEYVWLGGRPVALLRSKLSTAWARGADRTGTCTRNGDTGIACDVYGIVTDYLPKPVALIDSSARLAGTGDYDPFGHVDRVMSPGDSKNHPYKSTDHRILGYFNQPIGTGLKVDVRPRFAVFSTAAMTTAYLADQNETPFGPAYTASSIAGVAPVWTALSTTGGTFRLAFKPGDSNPDGLDGVVSEGYEYRRYQSGAAAAWLPVRFPGQYHDSETDLFQNWNRFYDPAIGRYLEPDDLWLYPEQLVPLARQGRTVPVYAYAYNNPILYSDPDGRAADTLQDFINAFKNTMPEIAKGLAALAAAAASPMVAAAAGAGAATGGMVGFVAHQTIAGDAATYQAFQSGMDGATPDVWVPAYMQEQAPDATVPGAHAGDSIPARGPDREFTDEERSKTNEIGKATGCHTCGTKDPGTKSGNFVPDHQPPSAIAQPGTPQRLFPQCLNCSRTQGGQIRARQQGKAAER